MFDHILIPLDGSPLAEDALEPAKKIVGPNGKITLITVVDVPISWDYGLAPTVGVEKNGESLDLLAARAKIYLEQVADKLRAQQFVVDTAALYGDSATAIVEAAATHHVEAIAMSTHGRSGFSRLLYGSVTSKVLSVATCPVLVIPSRRALPSPLTRPAAFASVTRGCAMERVEKALVINAHVSPIFHFLSEPFNLLRIWRDMVEVSNSVRVRNGGHSFHCVVKMANSRVDYTNQCTDYIVNQSIGYLLSGGIHGSFTWRFEPLEEQTRVTAIFEVELPAPLLKGHSKAELVQGNETSIDLLLQNLKNIIEAHSQMRQEH